MRVEGESSEKLVLSLRRNKGARGGELERSMA
jgi:hypothetical protein